MYGTYISKAVVQNVAKMRHKIVNKERVVDHLLLMTYGLKLSLEA